MAACEFADPLDYLTNFSGRHAFDLIYCPLRDVTGPEVLALFVFGGLALMFSVRDSSPIVPLVFAMLFGGVIITQLPAIAARMAIILFSLGVPIAVLFLYRRLNPPAR